MIDGKGKDMTSYSRPRVGLLWSDFSGRGDFPGANKQAKSDQLWSMGRVVRDVTHALNVFGDIVSFCPPSGEDAASTAYRAALSAFLRDIDVLWTDVYRNSTLALTLRDELQLPCPALFFVGGTAPKGIEALLFPWQHLLRSTDGLLFSSRADQWIWQQLAEQRELHEWVVPLGVDEMEFYPRSADECFTIRRRYHIPSHAPLLLYTGRLNIQKKGLAQSW